MPGGIGFLVISNYVKVFILFPQVNVKNIFIPALKVLIVTCPHIAEAALGVHPHKEGDKKVGVYFPQTRGGGTRSANERADGLSLGQSRCGVGFRRIVTYEWPTPWGEFIANERRPYPNSPQVMGHLEVQIGPMWTSSTRALQVGFRPH